MKIGKKVKTVPPPARGGRSGSKYQPLFDKIDSLSDGEFLPLQFEDERSSSNIYLALRQRNYDVRRRGLTLYVGKKG